jgi:hypothetical protein
MNYTEYEDDFTRRVPEDWSEAFGHATGYPFTPTAARPW